MGQLIMWNLITLDGYFQGKADWNLSFHDVVWGKQLEEFGKTQLAAADTVVFGRVTYEGMAKHWQTAKGETAQHMNSIRKVVCSRTLERADWNNTTIVRDAISEIPKLKQQGNLFVFGSGVLSASLMKAELFDEYRLVLVPVFLGSGKLLFNQGIPYQALTLLEARPLATGGIILRYAGITPFQPGKKD